MPKTTEDDDEPEEAAPGQVRPRESKPQDAKLDENKPPNYTHQDVKPGDEIRQNGKFSGNIKPADGIPQQAEPRYESPQDGKPADGVKPADDAKSTDVTPQKTKPGDEVRHPDKPAERAAPAEVVTSAAVNDGIKRVEGVNPTDVTPQEAKPGDKTPHPDKPAERVALVEGIKPVEIKPAEVKPTEAKPAGPAEEIKPTEDVQSTGEIMSTGNRQPDGQKPEAQGTPADVKLVGQPTNEVDPVESGLSVGQKPNDQPASVKPVGKLEKDAAGSSDGSSVQDDASALTQTPPTDPALAIDPAPQSNRAPPAPARNASQTSKPEPGPETDKVDATSSAPADPPLHHDQPTVPATQQEPSQAGSKEKQPDLFSNKIPDTSPPPYAFAAATSIWRPEQGQGPLLFVTAPEMTDLSRGLGIFEAGPAKASSPSEPLTHAQAQPSTGDRSLGQDVSSANVLEKCWLHH